LSIVSYIEYVVLSVVLVIRLPLWL